MLCAISNGIKCKTRMTAAAFARTCLAKQADTISQPVKGGNGKNGKVPRNKVCRNCVTGFLVKAGKPVLPPTGIEFIDV